MNRRCLIAAVLIAAAAPCRADDDALIKQRAGDFLAAAGRADVPAVSSMLELDGPQAAQFAPSYARLIIAGKHLADRAAERFPGSGDPFASTAAAGSDPMSAAQITHQSDSATVKLANGESLNLHKVADDWKVHLPPSAAMKPGTPPLQQLWLIDHLAEAMDQCATDIAAGKYATLADAKHAVQQQVGSVVTKVMVNDTVTTRPATSPTR